MYKPVQNTPNILAINNAQANGALHDFITFLQKLLTYAIGAT